MILCFQTMKEIKKSWKERKMGKEIDKRRGEMAGLIKAEEVETEVESCGCLEQKMEAGADERGIDR